MGNITAETTLEELAALVSQALERAGITATLSGGSRCIAVQQQRVPEQRFGFRFV